MRLRKRNKGNTQLKRFCAMLLVMAMLGAKLWEITPLLVYAGGENVTSGEITAGEATPGEMENCTVSIRVKGTGGSTEQAGEVQYENEQAITVSGQSEAAQTYAITSGTTPQITVTPQDGYYIRSFLVDGVECREQLSDNVYVMPEEGDISTGSRKVHQIEVHFAAFPQITITEEDLSEPYYHTKEKPAQAKVTISDSEFDENDKPKIIETICGSITLNGAINPLSTEQMSIHWSEDDAAPAKHILELTFQEEGTYEWNTARIFYKNEAGVDNAVGDAGKKIKFGVDTTKPGIEVYVGETKLTGENISESAEKVRYGMFDKESITVTGTATDAGSGMDETNGLSYYKDLGREMFLTRTELEGKEFVALGKDFGSIIMNKGEGGVIYIRAMDRAGNTSYFATNGIVVETYPCEIDKLSIEEESNKKCSDCNKSVYTDPVTIKVKVTEPEKPVYSGIKRVTYRVEADEMSTEATQDNVIWEALPNQNSRKQLEENSIVIDPRNYSGHVKVTVMAVDNAGNEAESKSLEFVLVDVPKVSVTFDEERKNSQYNKDRVATVTITDMPSMFSEEAAEAYIKQIQLQRPQEELPVAVTEYDYTIGTWEHDENKHTVTVTFRSEGYYSWNLLKAGNKFIWYENKASLSNDTVTTAQKDALSFTVDKTAPTGQVTVGGSMRDTLETILGKITFGLFSNKTLKVEIDAQDNISTREELKIGYCIYEGTEYLTREKIEGLTYEEYTGSFVITADRRATVYVRIADGADNITYLSSDSGIVEDDQSVITLTPKSTPQNHIYNSDVAVEVNVEEEIEAGVAYSGIKEVDYTVTADGKTTQTGKLFTFGKSSAAYEQLQKSLRKDVVVNAAANNSSNVVLTVTATDCAGNVSTASQKLEIDVTKPAITVSYDNNTVNKKKNNRGYFGDSRVATVVITERSRSFDAAAAMKGITITAVDVAGKQVELDRNAMISSWTTKEGSTENEATHTATITYTADANYTFGISYTDKAGNKNSAVAYGRSVTPKKFTIDHQAPSGSISVKEKAGWEKTWSKLAEKLTFGLYSAKTVKVTVAAEDTISGIDRIEYYKTPDRKAKTKAELNKIKNWKPYKKFSVSPNERFTVYVKLKDYVGNVAYISSDGVILDNKAPVTETTAPEISLSAEAGTDVIYNSDVKVSVKVEDPTAGNTYSGLKKVRYEVWNMDKLTEKGVLYNASTTKKNVQKKRWSGNVTVDSSQNNSDQVKVRVIATDQAGNTGTKTLNLKIDTTAPRVVVRYDNNTPDNGRYYREKRVATITITERNLRKEDIALAITNTDGVIPQMSEFQVVAGTGNLDNTRYVATVTYEADGDYTFGISGKDMAGNPFRTVEYEDGTMNPTEFTIDTTAPEIGVSYDNNNAANGSYFNAGRTATVTITEHNFDSGRVTFTQTAALEGTDIAVPQASWSSNGDVHTAVIAYQADGDYTFDVSMTDMAGNPGGAVNYGASAAANAFTIDQKIEKPKLLGVENGHSYKDDVIPEISFSDTNYENCEVQLLRTSREEQNVDVTKEFIQKLDSSNKGGGGANDTFAKVPENDGIYTLTVKQTDKAGNEASETTVFTVNRFGSVYDYNEYLSGLQDAYVQNVDKDIVITEYNPDPLVKDSQKVEISCDGSPLENIKYTVTPTADENLNAGENGWYQYEYTLAAENFAKDGIYRVRIASEDSVGNQPETTNYDDGDIIFRVDTTAPEISSITGLENAIVNADSLSVDYEVFDAIGLKRISVYADDKEIQSCDNFEDLVSYKGNIRLASGANQKIRLVIEDLAGNITDTDAESFAPAYKFQNTVTISTNAFIRWYANKMLFWCSIAGAIAVAGGAGAVVAFRIRKK